MIRDDDSDFPAPPAPQKGALAIGKDEIEKALNSPDNLENTALVHTNLAIAHLLVALCERIDRISEPLWQNKDGSIEYRIRTTKTGG